VFAENISGGAMTAMEAVTYFPHAPTPQRLHQLARFGLLLRRDANQSAHAIQTLASRRLAILVGIGDPESVIQIRNGPLVI
jgi:hypothetical protein